MTLLGADPVLAVHDPVASGAWYEAVFGCELVDIGGWVFCQADAVTFRLGCCPDVTPAREIGDHRYLAYVRVDNVDAMCARAVAADAVIVKELRTEPWGMREFAVESPDGHRFMIGQRLSG